MRLHIIAVGTKPPAWARAAFEEYTRRMPAQYRVHLLEVAPGRRVKHADPVQLSLDEAARVRRALPARAYVVALDRKGKELTSEGIASALDTWVREGVDPVFVLGGPDGLPEEFLGKAHSVWSLSPLTFPHMLARVMLAEQLYRAWSIMAHQPYHRGEAP